MAHTASSTPKPAKIKEFHKSWGLWAVAGACVLALLIYPSIASCGKAYGTSATEKPAENLKPVEQKVTKVVKIQLHPKKLSEWVSIAELKPPEVPDDARFNFQINAAKLYEFCDWTGESHVRNQDAKWKEWFGDNIPSSTFKLRGEGEAVIRIDYFFFK